MATTRYDKYTSPAVGRLAADLIALGHGWKGTARPVRLLIWTLTWVIVTAIVLLTAKVGIILPVRVDTLVDLAKHFQRV